MYRIIFLTSSRLRLTSDPVIRPDERSEENAVRSSIFWRSQKSGEVKFNFHINSAKQTIFLREFSLRLKELLIKTLRAISF